MKRGIRSLAAAVGIGLTAPIGPALAQSGPDLEELAKEDENPLARFVRVQIEDNVQFGFGPDGQPLNALRIQPVVPVDLGPSWSLITRVVVPIVHQPWPSRADGISDILLQTFVSPSRGGRLVWGLGPAFAFPSASDEIIGTGKWSAGPVGALVYREGPWVVGAIATNLWSFAGDRDRNDVNAITVRPLLNFNLPQGWYLTSSPVIAGNWAGTPHNRWLVPVGGGLGKLFRIANQPLSAVVEGFYHVVSPQIGPSWQLRFQLTLLYPR